MRSRISFAVILCVVLSVSACTDNTTDEGDVASYQDRYFEQLIFGASPDELTQILTIYEDRRQRSIAECMRNDGFEYTPLQADQVFQPTGVDLTSRTGRAEMGFGISTVPDILPVAEVDDPTIARYEGLDEATQAAYDISLSECEANSDNTVEAELGIPEAVARAQQAQLAIANDPAVVKAQNAWSSCMAEIGYDAPTEADLITTLGLEFGQLDRGSVEAERFRQRELEAAVASWDCGDELRTALQAAVAATNAPNT